MGKKTKSSMWKVILTLKYLNFIYLCKKMLVLDKKQFNMGHFEVVVLLQDNMSVKKGPK